MQKVDRKRRRSRPGLRVALLVLSGIAALVLAVWLTWALARPRWMSDLLPGLFRPEATEIPARESGWRLLTEYGPDEVAGVTVTLRDGEVWMALPDGEGGLVVTTDSGSWPVKSAMADRILEEASQLMVTDVLAEDLSALPDGPSAFGLEPARETVTVTYADGASLTFRVGSRYDGGDEIFYYMVVEDDPRLFALDVNTAEDLGFGAAQLIDVTQPVLQAARMDRISVEDGAGRRTWLLEGSIADGDAIDRWVLAEPFRYPADGEMITNLKTNAANLHLNSFIGEAGAELLTACGLDEPAAVIRIHMAPGLTYDGTDWPESEVTLTVGALASELQRYVLVDGAVYLTSDLRIRGLLDASPADTLTRYPVRASLSNLESLTRTDAAGEVSWRVDREGLAEGAHPSVAFTAEGREEAMAWSVFGARYSRMLLVTVDGRLPQGFTPGEPHTVWRFRTVTGAEHTIALADYDGSHDAVTVDGAAFFYLRKGALSMDGEM